MTAAYPPPTGAARSRWPRRLVIALVALIVLLVTADRVSLVVAEHVAASTIQKSQNLAEKPDVSVDGFPFLTQLASGNYDHITVTAHNVEVGPQVRQLRVSALIVNLHGVTITNNFHTVRAKQATATAVISYADLSSTLGATITFAGAGRVQGSAGATIAGVPLQGTISALPKISSSGDLSFTDTKATVAGYAVPPELNAVLSALFSQPIPLAGLPFGLHFAGLVADKNSIRVLMTGSNLAYTRS